jgi:hypothetical protein
MRSVSADGIRIVFGDPVLRTLLLFGWLAGFYILPEGLAAPYAHSLGGTAVTVGLLMAAVPLGTVIGGLLLTGSLRRRRSPIRPVRGPGNRDPGRRRRRAARRRVHRGQPGRPARPCWR